MVAASPQHLFVVVGVLIGVVETAIVHRPEPIIHIAAPPLGWEDLSEDGRPLAALYSVNSAHPWSDASARRRGRHIRFKHLHGSGSGR